jgi:hypothetical protein
VASLTHLQELERLERRLELLLRDFRILRRQMIDAAKDKGVLGSRGLTEFIIDLLRAEVTPITNNICGMSVRDLLYQAEKAGYAVPTIRTMSKRLTERAYRVGDIAWAKERGWYWKGNL